MCATRCLPSLPQRLARDGILYVSFNVLPGCRIRQAAWDVLHHHVDRIENPRSRFDAARQLARLVADGGTATHESDQALRAEFRAIAQHSDSELCPRRSCRAERTGAFPYVRPACCAPWFALPRGSGGADNERHRNFRRSEGIFVYARSSRPRAISRLPPAAPLSPVSARSCRRADRHDGALAAPARNACVGERGADGRRCHGRGPQARAQARSCGGRRRGGAQAARRARRQPAGDV